MYGVTASVYGAPPFLYGAVPLLSRAYELLWATTPARCCVIPLPCDGTEALCDTTPLLWSAPLSMSAGTSAQARRVTVDEAALKVGQRVVNSCAIEFGNMGAVL